ncbi:MAG: outer membrane protein precursor [Chitinophagaceae bacterium]|nr:outer membrane protein precursor [Chitinophagaceae bacterium]
MNQKVVTRLLFISNVALILTVLSYWAFSPGKEKVAFVNSAKVLSQFMGMKETQEAYQKKIAEKQAKLDTMQLHIQQQEQALSNKNSSTQLAQLNQSKNEFVKQKEAWEKEVTLEGNQLTQGMLTQINTYIENYAKDHGYLLVHGSNASGNILYADESIDVTDDIIKGLNAEYKN